jgi:hypothetical protein
MIRLVSHSAVERNLARVEDGARFGPCHVLRLVRHFAITAKYVLRMFNSARVWVQQVSRGWAEGDKVTNVQGREHPLRANP